MVNDDGGNTIENVNDLQPEISPKNESIEIYVKNSLETFRLHSKLNFREIPEITLDELDDVGEDLGKGGFGLVKAAKWKGNPYALKTLLPPTAIDDGTNFKIGASDLLKEAEFLSALSHPHIIGIHAKHTTVVSNSFILIDRLYESLSERMISWQRDKQKDPNLRKKLQRERIRVVCLGICDALHYLHNNHNVVFRDLKISNIGFDQDGIVKLFDFGIAKELKDNDKSSGKYKLSGKTGSLAYMAPEVAKNWKYDKKVDVYSFGILLWEIAALELAFTMYETPERMMQHVWNGEERPTIQPWWNEDLQCLMKKCWSFFAKSRPEFSIVKETLERIIDEEERKEEEEKKNQLLLSAHSLYNSLGFSKIFGENQKLLLFDRAISFYFIVSFIVLVTLYFLFQY